MRFSAASEDSLTLSWLAVLPPGGAFRLSWVDSRAASEGGSKSCPAASSGRARAQQCTISGLDRGRVYSVTVRSVLGDFEDPQGTPPLVASPAAPPTAARLCFLDRTEVCVCGRVAECSARVARTWMRVQRGRGGFLAHWHVASSSLPRVPTFSNDTFPGRLRWNGIHQPMSRRLQPATASHTRFLPPRRRHLPF